MDKSSIKDKDLFKIRKRKIQLEIETAQHIKKNGTHPLDILDDLIHSFLELSKIGLREKYPGASDNELTKYLQDYIYDFQKRYDQLRKRK